MDKNIKFLDDDFFEKFSSFEKFIHFVIIGTKPDIIKQFPVYLELKKRGVNPVLLHAGQHYDFNLSGGLEEEFGITPDVNLCVSGNLHQKISQMILRFGEIVSRFKSMGKIIIPYVHGDTSTAMAISCSAFQNEFASVHVEAGLRSMNLSSGTAHDIENLSFQDYIEISSNEENYWTGSIEPYPEQYNTRTTDASSFLFCAPVFGNFRFLEDEGYRRKNIFVSGNTIKDSIDFISKNLRNDIFEKYPALKDGFIRVCVHRRENCVNKNRFLAIFDMIDNLVSSGQIVLFILLSATKTAISEFGLEKRFKKLCLKNNFVVSDVWPYYSDVISAMKKCELCITDSGSIQEEMNILGIPCMTLRYGSDRPETIFEGCNVLAPPVNFETLKKISEKMFTRRKEFVADNLYGDNVSKKIVDKSLEFCENYEGFYF